MKIGPSITGFLLGEIGVPAEDGSEVYMFNSAGQHLRTVDPLTGFTRRAFAATAPVW